MNIAETAGLMLGSGLLSSVVTAWVSLKNQSAEIEARKDASLHLEEVEFRRSLLARIEQLEAHDEAKSDRLARQSVRIAELEHENRSLRMEVATLKQRLPS